MRAVAASPDMQAVVAVTGQHRHLVDPVNALFGVEADYDLRIGQPGQSLTQITTRALTSLEPLLQDERPDVVVVQGDTSTTLAGATAAFYQRVPVVHLEAGLRTGQADNPYPEEMNRRLTTRLAALHLAPTLRARHALEAEAVPPEDVVVTGNTVIDALRRTLELPFTWEDERLRAVQEDPRRMVLVTAHRRESWGQGMQAIGAAIRQLAEKDDQLLISLPLHPNPLVRGAILPQVEHLENVRVFEPQGYVEFCHLMDRSTLILTDSGGVQEEGPSLGKPVLVMRDTTERPEAVESGTAALVGTDTDTVVAAVRRLLDDPAAYDAMATAVNPYGDGRAVERSLAAVRRFLGDEAAVVEEFAGG